MLYFGLISPPRTERIAEAGSLSSISTVILIDTLDKFVDFMQGWTVDFSI